MLMLSQIMKQAQSPRAFLQVRNMPPNCFRESRALSAGASSKHPMKKKGPTFYPVHLSQRPPAQHEIDFKSLELKYPITHSTEFTVPRIGWAPPRENIPSLPFMVIACHEAVYMRHVLFRVFCP